MTAQVVPFPMQGAAVTVGSQRIIRRPEGTYFGRLKRGTVTSVSVQRAFPKIPMTVLAALLDVLRKAGGFGTMVEVVYDYRTGRFTLSAVGKPHGQEEITVLRVLSTGDLPTAYLPHLEDVLDTGLVLMTGRINRPAPELKMKAGMEGVISDIPVFSIFAPLPPRDAA